jgi:hypothetical protein
MAITKTTKWLFPPNWDDTEQQIEGYRRVKVQFTGISDAAGDETDIRLLDISKLLTSNNITCTRVAVEKIEYECFGFTSLKLKFDRNPKETIAVLLGKNKGTLNGPWVDKDDGASNGPGNTGDILLDTAGATSRDSYNIILTIKLKDSAPTPIQGG